MLTNTLTQIAINSPSITLENQPTSLRSKEAVLRFAGSAAIHKYLCLGGR